MKRESTPWNAREAGSEGRAEGLSERSARYVEKLMQRLARHEGDAEQLAEAMRRKRRIS